MWPVVVVLLFSLFGFIMNIRIERKKIINGGKTCILILVHTSDQSNASKSINRRLQEFNILLLC